MFSEMSYHVWIHGFQAKWSILWPHSWHSLFKWSHVVHKGASWNSKQCCLREFSFCLHGKFIFHFPSARNEFFVCERPSIYLLQNWTKSILWNTRPYLIHNWQNGWVSKVLIHLWWKRQILADLVGSGSNLKCSCLLFIFPKNHF